MSFVLETLSNGLTVVIEVMPHVQSAACGFLVRTGARDDPPELAGVAHFLEHMCFKGTPRRTAEELNLEFDRLGAEVNAQTGKDQTFYYSWARTADLRHQIDLLADMMRSTLPPEEFEVERSVVLEEIASYKDDLPWTAYDLLYEHLCAGNPVAQPVLGYARTIGGMTRDQMHAHFERRYRPDNLILAVAGNVNAKEVLHMVNDLCGSWQNGNPAPPPREPPDLRTGIIASRMDRFHQQAVALAFPSAPITHPLDESAEALAAIIGGTNSRFYWNIVQRGIATSAGALREEYADFGVIMLHGLCEPDRCEELLDAMRREAADITRHNPEPKEIQRVKNLRRTMLASEAETPGYRIGQLVDDVDYRGAPRPPDARLAEVDAVSTTSIAEYLREYPITGDGYLVSVGPREWPG